jgi:hypothetical protein
MRKNKYLKSTQWVSIRFPIGMLSMHSKCLDFVSFKFRVGGLFSFFLCSQHVPFKLPMGFHQVPNMFPIFGIDSFPQSMRKPAPSCFTLHINTQMQSSPLYWRTKPMPKMPKLNLSK